MWSSASLEVKPINSCACSTQLFTRLRKGRHKLSRPGSHFRIMWPLIELVSVDKSPSLFDRKGAMSGYFLRSTMERVSSINEGSHVFPSHTTAIQAARLR